MQQPNGLSKAAGVMSGAIGGWRGDGQQVPGNQPGGANGQFGRYGQTPDQQPTPDFSNQVAQQANDGGWGQVAAGAATAAGQFHNRYGMQGRADHSMNQGNSAMQQNFRQQQVGQMGAQPPSAPPQSEPPMPSTQDAPQPMNTGAPQGQQDQNGDPMMAHGGIVTRPTRAIIGESGPEAVVPLDGNPNAKLTPEMMGLSMPRQYNPTGPTEVKGPIRPMLPASLDPKMGGHKVSGWPRYNAMHPH